MAQVLRRNPFRRLRSKRWITRRHSINGRFITQPLRRASLSNPKPRARLQRTHCATRLGLQNPMAISARGVQPTNRFDHLFAFPPVILVSKNKGLQSIPELIQRHSQLRCRAAHRPTSDEPRDSRVPDQLTEARFFNIAQELLSKFWIFSPRFKPPVIGLERAATSAPLQQHLSYRFRGRFSFGQSVEISSVGNLNRDLVPIRATANLAPSGDRGATSHSVGRILPPQLQWRRFRGRTRQ